jgi:hypothetical protein
MAERVGHIGGDEWTEHPAPDLRMIAQLRISEDRDAEHEWSRKQLYRG